MHQTAYENAKKFSQIWVTSNHKFILDIGSYDVNGCLRPLFEGKKYVGLDKIEGPNVDIVYQDKIPFDDKSFDIIISTSCFEHDEFFWETFLEMCRVLKPNGLIYINAPSNGPYHAYPVDCWRFYKDSYPSLVKWAKKNSYPIILEEQYISEIGDDGPWADNVGIFKKSI